MIFSPDKQWMQLAYTLAVNAKKEGEVPVGAVLIDQKNELIGQGWNQTIQNQDPTAHAEIIAIRAAANFLQNHRLLNTTLYVTLEPCCMCAGALIQARVRRIVFATRDFKAGASGSVYNLLSGINLNHQVLIDEGIMQKECGLLLNDFFQTRR